MAQQSGNTLKSLRQAIWPDGPANGRDVAEALRDLWQAVRLLSRVTFSTLKSQSYSPPFYLNSTIQPTSVFITSCMVSRSLDSVVGATPLWAWTGKQVRVDAICGSRLGGLYPAELSVGGIYDITFLMVA